MAAATAELAVPQVIRPHRRRIIQAMAGMLIALCAAACGGGVENSPREVVDGFVESLRTGDRGRFRELLDWEEVMINQYYVSRAYYDSLTPRKQQEVVDSYRELFFRDYFPAAVGADFEVEKIYVARDISDAVIWADLNPNSAAESAEGGRKRFTLDLSLNPDRHKWYITNLNDFIQLCVLGGDYDPLKFYLPNPIE